jgi:hypothetical protein
VQLPQAPCPKSEHHDVLHISPSILGEYRLYLPHWALPQAPASTQTMCASVVHTLFNKVGQVDQQLPLVLLIIAGQVEHQLQQFILFIEAQQVEDIKL